MLQLGWNNFYSFEFDAESVLEADVEQLEEHTPFNFIAWIINLLINNDEHVAHLRVHRGTTPINEVLELLVVDVVGQTESLLLQLGVLGTLK